MKHFAIPLKILQYFCKKFKGYENHNLTQTD